MSDLGKCGYCNKIAGKHGVPASVAIDREAGIETRRVNMPAFCGLKCQHNFMESGRQFKFPYCMKFGTKFDGTNSTQIGGEHYKKHTVQPWDAISEWGLCYFLGNVLKYVVRYGDKGGLEDLKKARHYLDKKIELLENR